MIVIVVVMIVVVVIVIVHVSPLLLQRLEPVLVDVGLEVVAGRPAIAAPERRPARSAPCRAPAPAGRACGRRAARDRGRCPAPTPPRRSCRADTRACGNGRAPAARRRAPHRPARTGCRRRCTAALRGVAHHGIVSLAALRPAFACRARTSAMRASISSRVSDLLLDDAGCGRRGSISRSRWCGRTPAGRSLSIMRRCASTVNAPLVRSRQQDQHGVGALLPQRQVVLAAVDRPELEAADVVRGAAAGALARHVLSLRARMGSPGGCRPP